MSQLFNVKLSGSGITTIESFDSNTPSEKTVLAYPRGAEYKMDQNNENITVFPGLDSGLDDVSFSFDQIDDKLGAADLPAFMEVLVAGGYFKG